MEQGEVEGGVEEGREGAVEGWLEVEAVWGVEPVLKI
jgi:hypothetical protein